MDHLVLPEVSGRPVVQQPHHVHTHTCTHQHTLTHTHTRARRTHGVHIASRTYESGKSAVLLHTHTGARRGRQRTVCILPAGRTNLANRPSYCTHTQGQGGDGNARCAYCQQDVRIWQTWCGHVALSLNTWTCPPRPTSLLQLASSQNRVRCAWRLREQLVSAISHFL